MRYVYLIFFLIVAAIVSVMGFRGTRSTRPPLEFWDDLDHQPKYEPQEHSAFFADGRVNRLPVPNTVARTEIAGNPYLATGRQGDSFGSELPIEVDWAAMERGRERYDIYCTVCHGAAGDGQGRTADYGMTAIADLTTAPYTEMPAGEIFYYITHGSRSGRMMPYADKLSIEDRWKVVLYVQALQRAANGSVDDLTPAMKEELGL